MLSESSVIELSIFRFGVRVFYCRVRVSQMRVQARVRVFFGSESESGPGFEVCPSSSLFDTNYHILTFKWYIITS